MNLNPEIKIKIEEAAGEEIKTLTSLSGGCISSAYKLETFSGRSFFLKINPGASGDMFIKEAHGLNELRKSGAIKIPEVLLCDKSFILTGFISQGNKPKNFFTDFGRRLAGLHKYKNSGYGFFEDNYIGSNIQLNVAEGVEKTDWTQFYYNKRIIFQFKLAEKNGYATSELRNGISSLEKRIEKILAGSEEEASLLHGDLWGGNYLADEHGEACLIDPAVYYGNREADIAMTKLFGGFSPEFYGAYNEVYPLAEGYEYREPIYKLYHLLNHLNLFGRGYYSQVVSIIRNYIR